MAWTTFPTLTDGQVLTGAHMQLVRDNFAETSPAKATAAGQLFVSTGANSIAARTPGQQYIATLETTASATFVALTTPGPAVTVTTGTQAIVSVGAGMAQNTIGGFSNATYAVSGATTIAAGSGGPGVNFRYATTSQQLAMSYVYLQTLLTSGSNTFTMQYNAGSGGGTASFFNRELVVIPL